MAIEFNCPYCTATVRVGDESSGKIGRCPKCDTRIRIPQIPGRVDPAPPPAPISESISLEPLAPPAVAPTPVPPETTTFPDLTAPPPAKNPGELPIVPVTEDPVTSKYLKRRKKKSWNLGGLIPPLLFGGLFVAIGLTYYYWTRPSYLGTLEGERQNPNQSIQIELDGSAFNIDNKIFSQIVEELRRSPSAVRSNLVNLRFRAGAEGIEVALRPGSAAELIKVPVGDLKPVAEYYRDHFDELDDARINELQAALIELCTEWASAPEEEKNETLPEYRNSVFYNAFVKGLGRVCYALVDNAIYPCIHEDAQGALYFLVPMGTKSFVIKEREELEVTPVFPSEFEIQVTVGYPQLPDPKMIPAEAEDTSIPLDEAEPDVSPSTETTAPSTSPVGEVQ